MAFYLVIADRDQYRAPTALEVTVGDGDEGEEVVFDIDGFEVATAVLNANGDLFLFSVPVPSDLGGSDVDAGTHILTVTGVDTASATFALERNPSPFPEVKPADVDPVFVPGRGKSWALQDPKPGGLGTWIMHPSPTSMSEPELVKIVQVDHTTHPIDGQYEIATADDPVKPWTWSGYCPDFTFYENLAAFCALNRRIYVIDHRDRAWKVAISRFDPKARKRQVDDDGSWQDWAHDYTVTAQIYEVSPLVLV